MSLLVVDDALFMRETIKSLAKDLGIDVVGEATTGQQAIDEFRRLKPDFVTMDITMPGMSGVEAIKIIVDEFPTAKIIVVTALGQRRVIVDALESGAIDFLVKPFEREQLSRTLCQHIVI